MVDKAHSLGLRAGWYAGNYQCSGANGRSKDQAPWDLERLVEGNVKALKAYGKGGFNIVLLLTTILSIFI